MSGFFRRLASRAMGAESPLSPRLPGLFEGETWGGFDGSSALESSVTSAPTGLPSDRAPGTPPLPASPGVAASTDPFVAPHLPVPGGVSAPGSTVLPNAVAAVAGLGQRLAGPSTDAARRSATIAPPVTASAMAPALSRLAGPTQVRRAAWSGQAAAPGQTAIDRPTVTPPTGSASSFGPASSGPSTLEPIGQKDVPGVALPTARAAEARPPFATRDQPAGSPAAHHGAAQTENQQPGAPDAVEIDIGRIDVRFPPARTAPAPARPVGPPPLAELLARSRRRGL
jgi:hypothetical protein